MCGCRGPHAVHIGTSLADNRSSLSAFSDAELDARSALRVCHLLACLFVDSRASHINSRQINSSQVNLGGAHDVSKQRSSKFRTAIYRRGHWPAQGGQYRTRDESL